MQLISPPDLEVNVRVIQSIVHLTLFHHHDLAVFSTVENKLLYDTILALNYKITATIWTQAFGAGIHPYTLTSKATTIFFRILLYNKFNAQLATPSDQFNFSFLKMSLNF